MSWPTSRSLTILFLRATERPCAGTVVALEIGVYDLGEDLAAADALLSVTVYDPDGASPRAVASVALRSGTPRYLALWQSDRADGLGAYAVRVVASVGGLPVVEYTEGVFTLRAGAIPAASGPGTMQAQDGSTLETQDGQTMEAFI